MNSLKAGRLRVDEESVLPRAARRVLIALWVVFVAGPLVIHLLAKTTGHQLLPTSGTSMGPDRASLTLLERVGATEVQVADVISFRSGDRHVQHRVVAVLPGPTFVTKGDANPRPDRQLVRPEEIEGRRIATIPWWGAAYALVHKVTPEGVWLLAMSVVAPVWFFAIRDFWRTRASGPDRAARRALWHCLALEGRAKWSASEVRLRQLHDRRDLSPRVSAAVAHRLAACLLMKGDTKDLPDAQAAMAEAVEGSSPAPHLAVTAALLDVRLGRGEVGVAVLRKIAATGPLGERPRARLVLREALATTAKAGT